MSFFNKPKEPEPVCGGTDSTYDADAPKEIVSDDVVFFSATSELNTFDVRESEDEPLSFVSAYAARADGGTFLFLETKRDFRDGSERGWALVKADAFPAIAALTRECALAKSNGSHSVTHGLPQNFGGSVDIRYAGGERINFSDNQSPIISRETGLKIAELFASLMAGERAELPDISGLRAIRFSEERAADSYTRVTLTLRADGSGEIAKTQRYGGEHVYESASRMEPDEVARMLAGIEEKGVLAWAGLPAGDYSFGPEKRMVFVFDDREIAIPGDLRPPEQISGGFFDIELEIATKH